MAAPFLLQFPPGVQRDGTQFDAAAHLDALWCRFRLGRPRKMGGYQRIIGTLAGPARRVHCFYTGSQVIAHLGTQAGIQQVVFDLAGNLISSADRTPAGFEGGINVGFTFDAIFDTTSNTVQLVAHVNPYALSPASTATTVPFLGDITATTPLAPFVSPGVITSPGTWTQPLLAGGIACVQPFVFGFTSAGWVMWSAPNLPLYLGVTGGPSGAGEARISAQKVVAAMALRGGGAQSPAALFWSLSELIGATYIGGGPGFSFTTISPSSSILSQAGIIEYDGLYFWAGIDRFLVFNGTVNELPNTYNQDFFFNNLTPGYESRTYAFKVPRYGEIWWCAAMFGSAEPNHAIIFNLRENCWYDTPLPDGGRGAAYFAQGLRFPIMTGVENTGAGYEMWMHEVGTDKVVLGADPVAVRSFFETPYFGSPKDQQITDGGLSLQQIEPDVIQSGDMTITLLGQANARAPLITGPTAPIVEVPAVPQEQLVSYTPTMVKRLLRLHVESNVVGGNYIFGRNIAHGGPGEGRLVS